MALLETIPTGLMANTVRLRLRLDDLEHGVSPEMLDRFAAGSASRGERRVVLRHLLTGCRSCSRRLGRQIPLEHLQEPEGAYDAAFDQSLERAFDLLTLRQGEQERAERALTAR